MKNKKHIILLSIFYFILTSFSFSQYLHNTDKKGKVDFEKVKLINSKQSTPIQNSYKDKNIELDANGSPFNNNDNPQIDSAVIEKIISLNNEIIKYYYNYDSLGNVAIETKTNYWKLINAYDSVGNKINFVWEIWENNQWDNFALITSEYDSVGNEAFGLFQLWNNSNWENSSQTKYSYNSHGDLSSYISEDWDGSGWVKSFRVTYTYDSNYVVISRLNQNGGGNDWDGYTWRDTYTYDSNGNKIMHLSEDFINNQWINDIRLIYEYDENDNIILTFYDYWKDNKWISKYKWTNTFDSNGKNILYLAEVADSGKWSNSRRTFFSYSSEGYINYGKSEMWIVSDSIWEADNGSVFVYDIEGNFRSYFGHEVQIYYAKKTDIREEVLQLEDYFLLQNYPNPFNPSTFIRYEIGYTRHETQHVKFSVYNLLGQEVAVLVNKEQKSGIYEIKFDATLLPSGIYIYRLNVGDFDKSKKMILLK